MFRSPVSAAAGHPSAKPQGCPRPRRRGDRMSRRAFIAWTIGAATWPWGARAQQPSMPVVGYLSSRSATDSAYIIAAFHKGLSDSGFVLGRNIAVESRFAEGNYDRLPMLAADLVQRHVNVLVATGGTISAIKAKTAVPAAMPMLFAVGGDPIRLGIVASLSRPGGNITGVSFLVKDLSAKCIELLHELVPKGEALGFLRNPGDPSVHLDQREVQAAAAAVGKRLVVVQAATDAEIETAFASLAQQQIPALFVSGEPFLADRREKIVALAARYSMPAVYQVREFADAGGLAVYGANIGEANRRLGAYTGLVLKGAKPADLPVEQLDKFELIINLKTARGLGISIPPTLLLRADEVIE